MTLSVAPNSVSLVDDGSGEPIWANPLTLPDAFEYYEYSITLNQGTDFNVFRKRTGQLSITSDTDWLSLQELSNGVWELSGIPTEQEKGLQQVTLSLFDGVVTTFITVEILVTEAQYLPLATHGISGGANWTNLASFAEPGIWTYNNSGSQGNNAALLYTTDTFQSDTGFKLTVDYTLGSLLDGGSKNNLSFGFISTDTEPSEYDEQNPFGINSNVYSLGVNFVPDVLNPYGNGNVATPQGLIFTDSTSITTLDDSGSPTAFVAGETAQLTLEVTAGGLYRYSINGVEIKAGSFADAGSQQFRSHQILSRRCLRS